MQQTSHLVDNNDSYHGVDAESYVTAVQIGMYLDSGVCTSFAKIAGDQRTVELLTDIISDMY